MTYQLFRATEQHRGQTALRHSSCSLKWETGSQLPVKHTHAFSFSSTLCVLAVWEQLLRDNEELLHFWRSSTVFSLALFIYFLLSVYLCTFRFSLPVSSWLTPLKCLTRCGLLFSDFFFFFLLSGFPSRAWRKAEGDSKQYNSRGKRLRWPTCFTKLWSAFICHQLLKCNL